MDAGPTSLLHYFATISLSALVFAGGRVPLLSAKNRLRTWRGVHSPSTRRRAMRPSRLRISVDLGAKHPEITRAAIVFHGKGRNVEGYFSALRRAAHEAGQSGDRTLLWAPQFLREEDAEAHRLSKQVLRWHAGSWSAGEPASGPLPLSTFDVIDAMLATLADREHFPNLTTIVLIGHSGGGQLLNRYAIVGRSALAAAGIHLRFVIAGPFDDFYFSDDRPQPDGSFAPFHGAACPTFYYWRYGPVNAPAYVGAASAASWHQYEQDYAKEDVVYLLGTDDTDPAQVDLDTSCAGPKPRVRSASTACRILFPLSQEPASRGLIRFTRNRNTTYRAELFAIGT